MAHVERVNPPDDAHFVELVDTSAAIAGAPDELEALLRQTFPHAVVRSRGLSGEAVEVWYVYRDGVWVPPKR